MSSLYRWFLILIRFACAVLFLFSFTVSASQVVTLEDGRQVLLNDDFTWRYVEKNKNTEMKAEPVKTTKPALIAVVAGTSFRLNQDQPIQQLDYSGVTVVLEKPNYKSGQLTIPVSLTNNSSQSVILVTVDVLLRDSKGSELWKQSHRAWSSVKRLPDTYFRPTTQERGLPIEADVPELSEYIIEAKVVEVEHW